MDKAIEVLSSKELERIGVGSCGSVWSALDTTDLPATGQELLPFCIKREDGGRFRSVLNEQYWQKEIHERIVKFSESSFLVPRCYGHLWKENTSAWDGLLRCFSSKYEACNAMICDTIQPIRPTAYRAIINQYCPQSAKYQVSEDGLNRHCLLRLYLGHRQPSHLSANPSLFTLRNLPLHLDQIKELQLPVEAYVRAMARGLAFMNWAVGIDGNDVEFVLAPPRHQSILASGQQQTWDSPIIGKHSLWILDFDCCRELTLRDCVEQITRSFWRNDPYFPRPGCESPDDQELWKKFCDEYERTSLELMPEGPFGLRLKALMIEPRSLINLVTRKIEESRVQFTKA